jgi:hypothetical protein
MKITNLRLRRLSGTKSADGLLTVSDNPGFGYEIDPATIESEEELTFD